MKKILFVVILVGSSCKDDSMVVPSPLHGTWLLYETGFSPGAGYIVNEVPEVPAQTLTLNADGTVESTMDGFKDYVFYQIDSDVVKFYRSNPDTEPRDPNLIPGSFGFSLNDNKLRLNYRGCIEGCHMAFRQVQ
jgi:hypothetical protein